MTHAQRAALALILIGAAAYLLRDLWQGEAAPDEAAAPDADGDLIDWTTTLYTDAMSMAGTDYSTNERAFLRTIRHAEGTSGANGYRTLFGGSLFSGWSDHPRRAVQFTDQAGRRLWTTAAGAYQFMAVSPLPTGGSTRVDTWDRIKRKLSLPDFSPASQDAAALELIREAGALADVRAGRFATAISKCRGIWASLPGAGYSQPEKSLAELSRVYQQAGGVLA